MNVRVSSKWQLNPNQLINNDGVCIAGMYGNFSFSFGKSEKLYVAFGYANQTIDICIKFTTYALNLQATSR